MKRWGWIALVAVAACGDGGEAGAPDAPLLADALPAVDAIPDAGAPDALLVDPCSEEAKPPSEDTERTILHQDYPRSYRLHVPASYGGEPTALILNFHGFTSDAAQQEIASAMNAKSDTAGFIVAYPQGLGVPASWNAGACCAAEDSLVDDVAFTAALIDHISAHVCVDPKRVYATGLSNGGFLSYRLACELSDRIAAIGPVAGVIGVPACEPERPVPVIHFHGTADPVIGYEGGGGFVSVAETIATWVAVNGCTGEPVSTFSNGDSHCETYETCEAGSEVVLCTVEEGGHTWPGGFPIETVIPELGHTTTDLSANDAMWDFFLAHPLP